LRQGFSELPHIGKVYDLTGPESLTMAQFAQEFSGALGRTIRYVNAPPQIWEAKLRHSSLLLMGAR
jgi:uncharacterized protein YbjT (DUF2867 family)